MSDLYKRIDELCKQKGTNITEMCKASGASRGSLTDLKMGRISRLNTTTLSRIAEHFSVTVDFLLGNAQKEKPTGGQADGLNATNYMKLSPENREVIDSLIEKLLKSQSEE